MIKCPCCSGKDFADCCQPHLLLKVKPLSARAMVRARYCAYALGAGTYRDFLVRTWHPGTPQKVNAADLTNDNLQWTGLEIISAEQKGEGARVEFKATFNDSAGKLHTHHEISLFRREQGVWLYVDGRVSES
jgi:SEC-C motif-containing protein